MKIAAIQLRATENKGKNLEKALRMIGAAAREGASFIALPELFIYRGNVRKKGVLTAVAEKRDGQTIKILAQAAVDTKTWILAGSIYETSPRPTKVYNTSCLIKPDGKIAGSYRKIHLFNATLGQTSLKESDIFLAGKRAVSVTCNGWKAGLSICYDVRFPALYRRYAMRKAEIICIPSNFTRLTGKAHWEVLVRARAIETLSYVVAPNQVGNDTRDVPSFGHSMIVDPWGTIVARASGTKEEIIYADIHKKALIEARMVLPGIHGK